VCSRCGKESPWVNVPLKRYEKGGSLAILAMVVEKHEWYDVNGKPVCSECKWKKEDNM